MPLDLKKQRQRLEAKRAELRGVINKIVGESPTSGTVFDPDDLAGKSVELTDIESSEPLYENERSLLTQVEQALKNLDNGTYGRCQVCGKPIPDARLEAIPWANRDIEHASTQAAQ
jgi:RNA polymerase-binding transcription factor DksA